MKIEEIQIYTPIFIATLLIGFLSILLITYFSPGPAIQEINLPIEFRRYGVVKSIDYNEKRIAIAVRNPFSPNMIEIEEIFFNSDTTVENVIIFITDGIIGGPGSSVKSSIQHIRLNQMIIAMGIFRDNRFLANFLIHGDILF